MKTSLAFLLFSMLQLLPSCKTVDNSKKYYDAFEKPHFTGFNSSGLDQSCYAEDYESGCKEQDKAFEENCDKQGYRSFRCDCNVVLCSFNINSGNLPYYGLQGDRTFRGFTAAGTVKTCPPLASGIVCADNSKMDTFTENCLKAGGQTASCSCTEVLCSKSPEDF